MRGDNSINTSSLAGTERARKASEVRKNGQIFETKIFGLPLYLCNAVPSTPIKRNQMAHHTKCARKCKIKGRETEEERRKNARSNRKKKKINK